MERFDETHLESLLAALPTWKQVAFMLLCCERMLPNYAVFSKETGFGEESPLRNAVDGAWEWVKSGLLPKGLDSLRDACERQAPNTEEFRSELTSAALDAANAAAIVLDAIEAPSASLAVAVAALSRDTVDIFVQSTRKLDPADSTFEDVILADPLMQTELRRQHEDLAMLAATDDNRHSAVNGIRNRARQLYGAGSLAT